MGTADSPTGAAGHPLPGAASPARPGRAGSAERAVSLRSFVSIYLPALILALGTGIVVPVIPALAKSFHVSFGVASSLVTVFLIGNVAGTIPSGWLVDRFGRRPVMILGPLLTAVLALLIVTAHTFGELLAYRFFGGVAAQMWLIGRLAGISHGAAPGQRGRQVTWMFGMDNTGRLAGPLAGGWIAAIWGLRAPFVAYGILSLIVLAPAIVFTRDTPHPGARKKAARPPRPSFRELVRPRLAYFAVVLFASIARGPIQADLLHLYAAFAYHLKPQAIGYLAAGAGVVSVPIGLTAGVLMDRLGRKKTMLPGFTGVAIAMTALACSAFFRLDLAWYVVLFLAAIGAQALTSGSVQTLGADIAPAGHRGTFLGLWRFTGTSAAALSPVLFAVLASQLGYGSSFILIAASSVVTAVLLARYIPETRQLAPRPGQGPSKDNNS
ncbi:MAG TPA: MFS transporter [Streptosporangiaceae bacterium]